jgi:hypothetical protein
MTSSVAAGVRVSTVGIGVLGVYSARLDLNGERKDETASG